MKDNLKCYKNINAITNIEIYTYILYTDRRDNDTTTNSNQINDKNNYKK